MSSTALGRICAACGTERKKKGILYDPTNFMPYCENPYVCNEEHPNSPKNLIARGSELGLIPFDEAQEKFKAWLMLNQPDPDRAERIRRMVTQPMTIRIASPDMAIFILDLQQEYQFATVSDTIRYCIQAMQDSKGRYYADHARIADDKREVERVERTTKEVEQVLAAPAPKPSPRVEDGNPFDDDEEIVL